MEEPAHVPPISELTRIEPVYLERASGFGQALIDRFEDPERPLEGVVIEASGIADPKVTVKMLEETRLDGVYELRTVVSVIDPGTFLKLIHTLPNVIAQVEACDVALVNKTDLHDEAALRRV